MTMRGDTLLEHMLPTAAGLVCAVRDDVTATHQLLLAADTPEKLHALAVVLACMVPDDRPLTDLLAWTHDVAEVDWSEPRRREAHRLYAKGQRTPWVIEGERAYQRARKRPQRAA